MKCGYGRNKRYALIWSGARLQHYLRPDRQPSHHRFCNANMAGQAADAVRQWQQHLTIIFLTRKWVKKFCVGSVSANLHPTSHSDVAHFIRSDVMCSVARAEGTLHFQRTHHARRAHHVPLAEHIVENSTCSRKCFFLGSLGTGLPTTRSRSLRHPIYPRCRSAKSRVFLARSTRAFCKQKRKTSRIMMA